MHVHHLACRGLHLLGQLCGLSAVLLVGRGDKQGKRGPSVSTAMCTLLPFRRLAPSWPARSPLSGLDCSARLSKMAAVG
jgi:hypothetical protein